MVKKQCLKIDLSKVDFNKSATWNIFKQLNLDIETTKKKYNVVDFYIPQDEQYKLIEYLIANNKKCKYYNSIIRDSKSRLRSRLSWEVLGYFPSSIKKRL